MSEGVNGAGIEALRRRMAGVAPEPTLGDGLRNLVEQGLHPGHQVAARLHKKFGLGEEPAKRRELYRRLEALVVLKGRDVLDVISEAVADAVGARRPDRYFCKAVVAKLRERGFALGASPGGDPSW